MGTPRSSRLAGFVLALCLLAGPSCAQPGSPTWEGLYVAEKKFGPELRGSVTLQRSGEEWTARIQDESAPAERKESPNGSAQWSFSFVDHGRFVGHQPSDGTAITGHWIQAPGQVDGYPYATPARFEPTGSDTFEGEITPAPQTVSLNIPLIADGANTYRTFLRNPERNLGMFFRIESATVVGDEIRFANADGEMLAVGNALQPGERFFMVFPRFDESLEFTRRSREDAPGFYPRPSSDISTPFPRPDETGDGWTTTTPRESGLDESPLAELVGSIAAFEPTALRQPYIHAVLIAHRGKLVLEEYFHGYDRDTPHDSRSAGKSLASALVGIALHQGALESLDEPVYARLGGVDAYANPDPSKERMTVRHLVTMSSGFDCDDGAYDNPGNEDTMQSQDAQPDWYRYALDLPMVREPGEAGVYCSAGINLTGAVLEEATGRSLLRFFHEEFAEPLDVDYYQMNLSPVERGYMGGGIRLRPRDFLKLGQLFLDGGVWRGRRILSEDWARQSAAPQASLNAPDDYGFAWWRQSYGVGDRSVDTFYASGNGGQLLFVVPDLELVTLIHAGNYSDGRTRNEFRDRYMRESILPAALEPLESCR